MRQHSIFGIGMTVVAVTVSVGVGYAAYARQGDARPFAIAYGQEQKYAAVNEAQEILLYSVKTPTAAPKVIPSQRVPVTALAFDPSGFSVIAGYADEKIRRYSTLSLSSSNDLKLPPREVGAAPTAVVAKREPVISAVAFAQYRQGLAAAADMTYEIVVADSGLQRIVRFVKKDNKYEFKDAQPTNAPLVTVAGDGMGGYIGTDATGTLYLFDNDLKNLGKITPEGVTGPLRTLTVSKDGKYLVAGDDKEVRVWTFGGATFVSRMGTMPLAGRLPIGSPLVAAVFTQDGQRVIALDTKSGVRDWPYLKEPGLMVATVTPKPDPPKVDPPNTDPPKTDPPKVDPPKVDPPKADPPKADPPKVDPPKADPPKVDPPKIDTPKPIPTPRPTPVVAKVKFSRKEVVPAHNDRINAVAFSPDGKRVVSGSRDMAVKIISVDTGLGKLYKKHTNFVGAVAFNPNGKTIASGGWDNKIYLWDANDNTKAAVALSRHTSPVLSVAFNKDGSRLVSGSDDQTAIVWSTANGSVIARSAPLPLAVATVAYSPNGKLVAGGCLNGSVYFWDAATMKPVGAPIVTGAKEVYSLTFVDDNTVVIGGKDGMLRVCSVATRKPGAILTTGGQNIFAVDFDPKTRTLAAGGTDRVIRLWTVPTSVTPWLNPTAKAAATDKLEGHQNVVRALQFSEDGTMLASGDWDGNIFFWQVGAAPTAGVASGNP